MNDYALYVIRPALARVPGTGAVEVQASDTREIEVVLDPIKLSGAGLTVMEVSDKLRGENLLAPVGRFAESGQQHLSLASGLWTSVDQIAAAPIIVQQGATIRVSDLGKVTQGAPDRTLLVTANGRDAVSLSISQQIGANILDLRDGVDQTLNDLAHTLPAGLKLTKVYDLGEFVALAIANVRDAILIGGFLAVVVLVVFLRDLRLTLIAAITLPMAVISTFLFLHVFGGSINLMSMGGLAVAIGLVIDDAVVVVENIHRRASEGADSVVDAVSQLMAPLTSSTLTTVVVFAPLGLLSGVAGQFFRALSLTLSVAVLLSLGLSVTVVPLLARWAFRHHQDKGETTTHAEGALLRPLRPQSGRHYPAADSCGAGGDRAHGGHRRPLLLRRHRLHAAGGRRWIRRRHPDAGRIGAGRNRSPGAGHRETCCSTRRRSPPSRGEPARNSDYSRPRKTRATSWSG